MIPDMTTAIFLGLFLVWAAAIVSPGPDLVQIIRLGSRSRSDGIWTALGIMVGNTIWIAASLLGLSALLSASPGILSALQLIGGSYLIWMGTGAVRSWWGQRQRQEARTAARSVDHAMEVFSGEEAPSLGAWPALRAGIATNLANPKAVLFYGSVFAQFIKPDMGPEWSLFIATFLIITGVLWFLGFAVLVRTFAVKITRNSALIDLITGVIFMALGMFMVWQGVVGIGGMILG